MNKTLKNLPLRWVLKDNISLESIITEKVQPLDTNNGFTKMSPTLNILQKPLNNFSFDYPTVSTTVDICIGFYSQKIFNFKGIAQQTAAKVVYYRLSINDRKKNTMSDFHRHLYDVILETDIKNIGEVVYGKVIETSPPVFSHLFLLIWLYDCRRL